MSIDEIENRVGLSLEVATARAKGGDGAAQYALSSALYDRGRFDESLHWLRLAAAQHLIPAQMTLALMLMDGRRCPRDRTQAIRLLEPLAATEIQANLFLGELYGFAALGGVERGTALRYVLAAARLGDAGALRQLALLSAGRGCASLVEPLLQASAQRGDAAAVNALAHHPHQAGTEASTGAGSVAIDWQALDDALPLLAADIPLPAEEILSSMPLVRRLPAVVHPLVLQTLIHTAAPLVQRSQIVDARTGEARADPKRNSSHVTLSPRQHDHLTEAVEACISRITGLSALNGEFLQILRYRHLEEFRPHVDYFNEGAGGAQRWLAHGGQRAQTVLMYLNEEYAGGETCFPTLGLEIRGRRGDVLHFHNLHADGSGHRDTLHAGQPVLSGEKWLLSQWIRRDHYPARLGW